MTAAGRHQRGFALAAVLWLLAGLTVVLASVSRITLTSAERVAQLRQRADFMESAYGTRAHLLYWLSGTGTDANSFTDDLQRVRADGATYQAVAGSTVRLQDVSGLVALNTPNRALLRRHLLACDVDETKIDSLIDSLEDYADSDDLVRTQGAERQAYAERSLPPPRNAPLLSVGELWRVIGWGDVRAALEARHCEEAFTAEPPSSPLPNLATAPPSALLASGIPEELIRGLRQEDRDDPVSLQAVLGRLAAAAPRPDGLGGAHTNVQRMLRVVHQQAEGGPWRLEYTLRLTPDVEDRPWQIVEPTVRAVTAAPAAPAKSVPDDPLPPAPIRPWPDTAPAKQISHVKKLLSL